MTNSAALPSFAASSRLLSLRQTMELLNCRSRTTLYRYRKFGLKPIKMGKNPKAALRYRFDEVMYWLDLHKAE